jgi:hypothetical protein
MSWNNIIPAWMLGSPAEICKHLRCHKPVQSERDGPWHCQICGEGLMHEEAWESIARRKAMGDE